MSELRGKALADLLNDVPAMVENYVPAENREKVGKAAGLMVTSVQAAVIAGNLSDQDVLHGCMTIIAAAIVLPGKGMIPKDLEEQVTHWTSEYAECFADAVNKGKMQTHNGNNAVN
jgi:hypothetical protein